MNQLHSGMTYIYMHGRENQQRLMDQLGDGSGSSFGTTADDSSK